MLASLTIECFEPGSRTHDDKDYLALCLRPASIPLDCCIIIYMYGGDTPHNAVKPSLDKVSNSTQMDVGIAISSGGNKNVMMNRMLFLESKTHAPCFNRFSAVDGGGNTSRKNMFVVVTRGFKAARRHSEILWPPPRLAQRICPLALGRRVRSIEVGFLFGRCQCHVGVMSRP